MARPYAHTPATRAPAPAPRPPPTNRLAIVLPAAGILAVASIVFVFVALPIMLRSRCISMAAERGVTLTLDHVAIGLGEIKLVKVAFALNGVPQLTATADDAQVTLSGLTPSDANVGGLKVVIDGSVEEVQKALDAWRAGRAKPADTNASTTSEQKISFVQGHLTWTRAFGQSGKLDAPDATGDIEASAGSLRLTAEHLTLTAGNATLGPWRTTLERDAQGTRTNIELDPVVHGGPSVLYVRSLAGTVSISAKIPRSPLSRLGFPAKAIRLGSDGDVEAQISFEEAVGGATTLTTSIALSHTVFSGFPIDVAMQLHAVGDVTKGLDVKEGTLKAGPLTASATGTLKLFDDGARLTLAWIAKPVSCAEMGKQLATQALGGLGTQLGALAQDVGGVVGLRVTGNAAASGLITLDSRDVSTTSFGMTSNETCGLALF
jgi:hypothetical protein